MISPYLHFIWKKTLLFSIMLISLLFLILFIFFHPSYETNDDLSMTMVVKGIGTVNEPSEYVLFSNILLGNILKELYILNNNIPWYGLYIFSVLFIANVVLLFTLLTYKKSVERLILFLIFFFALQFYYLSNLQFTTVSLLIGQAGVFLFISGINKKEKNRIIFLGICLLLLTICFIIRRSSFYLLAIISLPLIFSEFIREFDTGKLKQAAFIIFTVFIIVITLNWYCLHTFELNPDWKGFHEFNKIRTHITDSRLIRPNDPKMPDALKSVNWSYNDYRMLMNFYFTDSEIYSKEKMEKVLSFFPPYKPVINLGFLYRLFKKIFCHYYTYTSLALIVFFILLNNKKANRRFVYLTFANVLLIFILIIYLFACQKLPSRVLHPMLSFVVFTALFFTDPDLASFKKNNIYYKSFMLLYFGLCIFLATLSFVKYYNYNCFKWEITQKVDQAISLLNPKSDELYVIWNNGYPFEYISPLDDLHKYRNFKLLWLGSGTNFGKFKARLREFDIDDITEAFFNKDNVFIVYKGDQLKDLACYIKEHYNEDVVFIERFGAQNLFYVYKIIKRSDYINKYSGYDK